MLHAADDAIGNLSFSPSPEVTPVHSRAIGAESIELARSILLDIESDKAVTAELISKVRANTAMGGARPKLMVEMEGRLWLAKFPAHGDDPLLPVAKLEAAMLNLARHCGIHSASARVMHEDILLVERFDRGPLDAEGRARRDGFLSARTLFESNGVRYGYGGSYVRLAAELTRYSCQGSKDKAELFRRMVFNALISNTDDHERNHGLVADDLPGTYCLSPAYDLVPRIHGTTVRHQAMAVGGSESKATRENLLTDCEAFGLGRAQALAVFNEIFDVVSDQWRSCLTAEGISAADLEKMERCFTGIPDGATKSQR
jgi:serine/threonine-protein kinase HipA